MKSSLLVVFLIVLSIYNPINTCASYKSSRSSSRARSSSNIFINVDDYGAKANGEDDSEAFVKAWNVACSSRKMATVIVTKNKAYQLKPTTFSGPCRSNVVFRVQGTIKASSNRDDYEENTRHWIIFNKVRHLKLKGGGNIDGNGDIWWKNSCKVNKNLAVTFNECKNLLVSNLKVTNAQQMHISFQKSVNVRATNLNVISPARSPNTDGIHVTASQNVKITNSLISTGDDCISIVSGSQNVQATGIICGPGHGISIGSLGEGDSEAEVSNIFINKATLTGTTNGVRIKTWQGGSGYAKNIQFNNIVMRNVSNPIIIDQNYCDQKDPCSTEKSAVKVSTVVYNNIKGTSATKVVTKFNCSKAFPCENISLQDVMLSLQDGGTPKASCENVNLSYRGDVAPKCSS